ncbi:DUF22 domain-containing protein [Archaeoglobus neptunius]|uniref:DUF22 domain-containing protein n=1 Tax=Archaeoglobus neptunius TaxID=2798580 RepID=UPI0019278796|nr:DUF22 domain-containing protein [Archaeoglobus neptunius]
MKVRTVSWEGKDWMEVKTGFTDVHSANFKSARKAYWKLLVANQEIEVKKGKPVIIGTKEIILPPKTAVSPLSIMRHALGAVFDVFGDRLYKIEEEKRIVSAAYLPVEDGVIEIGDVIGVIKVFPMNVTPSDFVGSIEEPDVNISIKEVEGNLVYTRNGKIVRERRKLREYWYRRWNVAEWYPLIAREDVDVVRGKSVLIRVENVELPENTIPVPLSVMRHALGTVVDVAHAGKPRKVEERKLITHALFVPAFNGRIEKGDLVGVLNAYYISTGERASRMLQHLIRRVEAKHVFWKNGRIVREKIVFSPFSFKRSSIGKFEPLIAAESKELEEGDVELIRILDLELPSGTIVQPLTAFNHAFGSVIDLVSSSPPRLVEEDRSVSHALVMSVKGGRIEKGDLLGAVSVYNVSVLREPEFFISRYREMFARQ